MTNPFKNLLRKFLGYISSAWDFIKDLGAVLKYCRFSVFMLLVGLVVLVLTPQGQDVLRVMVEVSGSMGGKSFWQWIIFLLAMGFWGLNAWYWARVMLRVRFKGDSRLSSEHPDRILWLNRHVPRILGTLAFFIVALGFARAAIEISGLPIGTEYHTYRNLLLFSVISVLMGLLFLLFVAYRRDVISGTARWLAEKSASEELTRRLQGANLSLGDTSYAAQADSVSNLGSGTVTSLLISVAIAIGFLLLFTFNAQSAIFFGTGAILLLAAATWIPIGSILVWWGSQHRVPVLTLLVIYLFVCSFFNDNHALRFTPADGLPISDPVVAAFDNWLTERAVTNQTADPVKVYLVAAEGGGIRAAYWTAIVLSALQDQNASFGKNLFAISGVSGGSLGAAVFNSLLKEQASSAGFECTGTQHGPAAGQDKSMQACAEAVLGHDFLSPTVAAMLYPDLVQRFLPVPFSQLDRARALEGGWESGWAVQFQNNRFAEPFHELWKGHGSDLPALFLNGTSVETGKRIITSNIAIDEEFSDAFDFFAENRKSVPLSTAVHNSARFTFVSPAGLIEQDDQKWGRIVDGGYFENSGATTAAEVFANMMDVIRSKENLNIDPVFIMITNDPNQCKQEAKECAPVEPGKMLPEILSPILSILKTRNSRGSFARKNMQYLVESHGGVFVEFGLQNARKKGPLPLGWVMSETAQDVMQAALNEQLGELPEKHKKALGLVTPVTP